MQVIEIEQGSPEWLELRRKRIGASEIASILGVSPWETAYETWCRKTGRVDEAKESTGEVNFAVARGNRMEPVVRARYELMSDVSMTPVVMVHPEFPWILASLDGWNEEKKLVLEIKCAGREVMEMAKSGQVHQKYAPQLEHQMIVTGAEMVHFYVAKVESIGGREQITDTALVEYRSNPELKEKVWKALHWFWDLIQTDTPPPLTEKDYLVLEDQKAKEVFNEIAVSLREIEAHETAHKEAEFIYNRAKEELDQQRTRQRNLEASALGYFSHQRVKCSGVLAQKKVLKSGETKVTFKLV